VESIRQIEVLHALARYWILRLGFPEKNQTRRATVRLFFLTTSCEPVKINLVRKSVDGWCKSANPMALDSVTLLSDSRVSFTEFTEFLLKLPLFRLGTEREREREKERCPRGTYATRYAPHALRNTQRRIPASAGTAI